MFDFKACSFPNPAKMVPKSVDLGRSVTTRWGWGLTYPPLPPFPLVPPAPTSQKPREKLSKSPKWTRNSVPQRISPGVPRGPCGPLTGAVDGRLALFHLNLEAAEFERSLQHSHSEAAGRIISPAGP